MSYYFARYIACFVPPACLHYSHHVLESARGMISRSRLFVLCRLYMYSLYVLASGDGRPRVTCIRDRPPVTVDGSFRDRISLPSGKRIEASPLVYEIPYYFALRRVYLSHLRLHRYITQDIKYIFRCFQIWYELYTTYSTTLYFFFASIVLYKC